MQSSRLLRFARNDSSWGINQSFPKGATLGNVLSKRFPSLEACRPGWILTVSFLIITTVLWTAARFPNLAAPELWPWRGLAQLTILWSITLMATAMLAVVRAHALEPVFGGLDRAVRFHRILPSAILLLIAHVIFLALAEFQQGTSIGDVFIPFWSQETRSIDILVFYALLALGLLAYDRRMSHERWLSVHRLTGLVFLAGAVHGAMEPGTIADFEPLRTWVVILLLAGGAAWLYRVIFFNRLGPRYRYRLETVVARGSNIIDLVMRPLDRRMMYEPGTFAFLRVPSMEGQQKELHPFSISSSPVDRDLRLSIRTIGDFTRRLPSLKSGRSYRSTAYSVGSLATALRLSAGLFVSAPASVLRRFSGCSLLSSVITISGESGFTTLSAAIRTRSMTRKFASVIWRRSRILIMRCGQRRGVDESLLRRSHLRSRPWKAMQ